MLADRPLRSRTLLGALLTLGALVGGCQESPPVRPEPSNTPSAVIETPPISDRAPPPGPITAARVEALLETLLAGGPRPSHNRERTRETLEILRAVLEPLGYHVWEQPFRGEIWVPGSRRWVRETRDLVNLFAERRGTDLPHHVVEVCAHYDTTPYSPGADDNSSGVVGALEVARVLAREPFRKTIRFCFFGAEEDGLLGSKHHVAQVRDRGIETIDALINLEMIGYTRTGPGSQKVPVGLGRLIGAPEEGTFVAVLGSAKTADLGQLVSGSLSTVPDLEVFPLPRLGSWFPDSYRSDNAPYWTEGWPAVMVTDTANFRNPYYHSSRDRLETLDLEFLRRVATGIAEAVRRRANAEPAPSSLRSQD